jgi:hypothetical protein
MSKKVKIILNSSLKRYANLFVRHFGHQFGIKVQKFSSIKTQIFHAV